jgi:hypothetical protein
MAMSRKHYQKMADILSAEHAITPGNDHASHRAIDNITMSVADMFKQDNARFDRDRFYAAAWLGNVKTSA